MSMKYLWTLTLVVVSVGLMVGAAAAQDAWQVALDEEDPPNRIMDLPTGLNWDGTYAASVDAENTGTTTWITGTYVLTSVEGSTDTALTSIDRWGLTSVALGGDTPSAAVNSFAFDVTAPPISGTFECDWTMGSPSPFGPDLAEADVLLTRFPDTLPGTAGEWAAGAVEDCAGRVPPIVLGYADGLYRPGLTINRAAMAVYMQRAAMIAPLNPAEPTFPDVPADYWAYGSVEACADAEIVFGYGDGSYQPELGVTRAQMAVYVARAVPLDFDPDVDPAADPFPDVPIGFWADNEIEACVSAGVVQGYPDGLYRPTAWVDRGQMAVYSMRAFIEPTFSVVVMGGPGTTEVPLDPLPDYHGWSTATVDPDWAYVEFAAAHLGPELAAAGGGTWDVTFYFGADATPTSTPESVTVEDSAMVSFDAADLTGLTGDYFTAAAAVPAMTSGMKLLWATVETPTGGAYQLGRTMLFEQSEPPPPPGAPRVPNALGGNTWLAADVAAGGTPPGWGDGWYNYHGGTYSNMKTSDDQYFVFGGSFTMTDTGWSECCLDPGRGLSLKWTGFEIPAGATEMKVILEYHVYDPQDGTGLQAMSCNVGWCTSPGDTGATYPNFCLEWDWPGGAGSGAWIDEIHPNFGWGLVVLNFADPWDWDGSGTGSPSAEIQDLPAEGALGGAFAYNPQTDMVMEWTVSDWTNFVQVGAEGNEALIHWCGGSIWEIYVDQCTLEFNPH